MYLEEKFYSADDALITGIKAILAEEYSRELSKKINNAHKNRQRSGGAVILTSNTYGYYKLPDKSIGIVEAEAEIKRRMYELCAAGYGSRRISAVLKNEGILNRNGKLFSDADILRMIKSPLNKGTVIMNQSHYDFDTKKRMRVPKEEQFIYENKVPAIVSKELWERANLEIERRAGRRTENFHGGKYTGKSVLSGRIFCGICGNPYYRIKRRDGETYEWKCRKYLESGRTDGCKNIIVREEQLFEILAQRWEQKQLPDQTRIHEKLLKTLKILWEKQSVLEAEQTKEAQIKCRMQRLADKLLDGVISDELYKIKQMELETQLEKIQNSLYQRESLEEKMQRAKVCLKNETKIHNIIVEMMLEEIKKIIIYPEYMEIQNDEKKIQIDYGNMFQYQKRKKKEREKIVELMRQNPHITAKQIAIELNMGKSGINYKINVLKKEGRIRYKGKGGRGVWEVIKN